MKRLLMVSQQLNKLTAFLTKVLAICFFLVLAVVLVQLVASTPLSQAKNKQALEDKQYKTDSSQYLVKSPYVPPSLTFAGDPVPINYFDVRESLDRQLLAVVYWHSQTIMDIKRASRYFPIIEPILKKHDIPDDFKYLAIAESNLTNAVSPAGARGVWQFLTATGKEFKLEINNNDVDERYHLEKSTEAACLYLKRAYNKYKDWALVAASYNYGQGNLDKQLKRQQANNYYDLLLNPETGNYVYRIIAIKLVHENPRRYGFDLKTQDLYQPIPTYSVEVDTSINDMVAFAQKHKTNYKVLKYLNPWLRESYLKVKPGKSYQIVLPKEGRDFTKWHKD